MLVAVSNVCIAHGVFDSASRPRQEKSDVCDGFHFVIAREGVKSTSGPGKKKRVRLRNP